MERLKRIYLAGNLSNVFLFNKLKKILERKFKVFSPIEIEISLRKDRRFFPYEVYKQCLKWIKDADLVLVNLESYGKDTSWEVGFTEGLGKIAIGLVSYNTIFLEDWMVKYSLDKIIVFSSEDMRRFLEKDRMIKDKIIYIPSIEEVVEIIENSIKRGERKWID